MDKSMPNSRFILYASIVVILSVLLVACCGTRQNNAAVQIRSERVQSTLGKIATALEMYLLDWGEFPPDLATLRNKAYILLDPEFETVWKISFKTEGFYVKIVEATSTDLMPDGEGWHIAYHPGIGSLEGYGIDKFPNRKK